MAAPTIIQSLLPRLLEDELFLAVEKPAGLDVGGMEGQTGVFELLSAIRGKRDEFFVVNRLSRYESGVLLLAKTTTAAEFVRNGLKAGRVDQEFIAIVIGRMKEHRLMLGGASAPARPMARRGARAVSSRRDLPLRGAVSQVAPVRQSGAAPTTLTQIERGERRTLIRARTMAANTHVLRAQLRSVRLRLVGDNVHDPSPKRQFNEATCLHLSKFTFHHPDLRTRVCITSPAPDFSAALAGGFDVERVLRAALARRLPLLLEKSTDSFRLITGPLEGLRGINAEIFGDVVVLYVLDQKSDDRALLMRIAKWYATNLGVSAVYAKPFVKDRIGAVEKVADRLRSPKPIFGRPAPDQIETRERNLRYYIRPYDGFSVGLFLDHRENRARIHDSAKGADMLNLFAYTCGFSVAAAVGGAKSTTSVDVSAKNLEWGRANFALNHIPLPGEGEARVEDPPRRAEPPSDRQHSFIRSDAMDYLRRAKRQEKLFDLIVIDPPSFAHGRGSKKDFSIVTGLPELIAAALEVLRPGGGMMVSTNYRKMSLRELKELVRKGAGRRKLSVIDAPPLPLDFAIDRDHAKTVFLKFDAES